MSTKTTFKRIALVAVAALGFGVLSVAPSQATYFGHTLTIDAAADATLVNETATAVLTNSFSGSAAGDSITVKYTCSAAVGLTCVAPVFYQTTTSDTSNIVAHTNNTDASETTNVIYGAGSWTDSLSSTTAPARSVINVKVANIQQVGTYTYTFYTLAGTATSSGALTGTSVTWTVTVSRGNTTATTGTVYLSADNMTAYNGVTHWYAASDSAIVADRGSATTATPVGYAFISPKNSAGETFVTNANGTRLTVDDSVTVSVTGPGYVSITDGTNAKSVTMNVKQHGEGAAVTSSESLTILNDGTAGTMTLTFTNKSGVVIATKTVIFSGNIASFSQVYVASGETTVSYTGTYSETATIYAYAKDTAGNLVTTSGPGRTVYLYSSDTAVVGDINGSSLASGRVGAICAGPTATGLWTCTADVKDSGTATLTVRDSSTVTLSTLSSGITFTITGNTLKTLTATFDKGTYTPGERAVLTLTGKDTQGKALSGIGVNTKSYSSAFSIINTSALGTTASSVAPYCGTKGVSGTTTCVALTNSGVDFTPYKETSVETRVVTMPTTAGAVTYEFRDSAGLVLATLSATVVDPTKDAADAATDAALEATDAAYAAQDAAQLAAEAADAATAAAEAATAAVEDLATQVASLFADLQKQITTLANVVAKIAKKVKA